MSVMQFGQQIFGLFGGVKLSSDFQSIYSLYHRRCIGYEALLCGQDVDGLKLSPAGVFSEARNEGQSIYLDRLCTVCPYT
ncbi:MAG: hypothetical protein KGL58_02685 [Pseudomonadota bacterium]|nr:hypothetical protein [Pseudomonadota bacterium]